MMDAPAYRLCDVRVEQAARLVLDIARLDLLAGRVTAVVGPNGAGKSTLLRVLGFLLPPTSGTVEFAGRAVVYRDPDLSALRRQATVVAQAPLLFHRSVYANVAYGLRARRGAADSRVESALAAVGLAGFAERPAWKLSGGEVQRVAIARALAIDPPVYLFDEPTGNVDRQHVPIVESLITQLGATAKTVIFTTHNFAQAYRLADALISLTDGHVAPFPLINVLRGTAVHMDGHNYFLNEALRIEIPDGVEARTIAIDPDAIIVSREFLHSSARNCFAGHIRKVEHDADGGLLLTVDCGHSFVARITRHSYEEMAFNVGTGVYLTFKASAIHILD
jgi:molybdopterin-binding protein